MAVSIVLLPNWYKMIRELPMNEEFRFWPRSNSKGIFNITVKRTGYDRYSATFIYKDESTKEYPTLVIL